MFRRILTEWTRHPSLSIFLTTIEDPIQLALTSSEIPVVLSRRQRLIYRLYVSALWEAMLRNDIDNIAERVNEPEQGNPIRIWRKSRLISQDLANSIIECNIIKRWASSGHGRQRVAEVGAGSGRLAQVYLSSQPGIYFIFDIPPALYVSQSYLSNVFPDKNIFRFRRFQSFETVQSEIEAADLVFCTANQIKLFPSRYFDAIVTISTLPEMRPDQVAFYLTRFQILSRGAIYIKQWVRWKNEADGTDISREDYNLGDDWRLTVDTIDTVNPLFFNRVWRRK